MLRLAALLLALALGAFPARAEEDVPAKSTIFAAHDSASIDEFQTNKTIVAGMVNALVLKLTGRRDVADAWRSLVRPEDRVGIKISAAGGRYFSTHRAIVDAIADGLKKAGVPAKNILVWDRGDLTAAGYRDGAYQVRSIEAPEGYDPKQIFTAPLMGKLIWGDAGFVDAPRTRAADQLSSESHLARLLATVTRIINVPVMSANEGCGVAGALYNMTIPNIDNWRRFATPAGADFYLPELFADDRIRPKVALNIMDGLIAQYAGGPEFQPNYAFHHCTIYASKDPVALDANALREITAWRVQAQLPPIADHAHYVQTAAAMGLGHAAPDAVALVPAP